MSPKELKICLFITAIFSLRIFGMMMILPVLPIYIKDFSGSVTSTGIVIGIYGIMQALLQLPLGFLSDRYGRRIILFVGLCLLMLGSLICYIATTVGALVIGRAIQGSGAIGSTLLATIADHTTKESRTLAMAILGATIGLSFFLAILVGPIITVYFGFKMIFLLTALLSLLALAFLYVLPENLSRVRDKSSSIVKNIKEVIKNTQLIRLDISILMLHFVYTSVFVLIPTLLVQNYKVLLNSHSYFYASTLLVSLLLSIPMILFAEKYKRVKSALLSAVTSYSVLFILIHYPSEYFYLLALAMVLFFAGFTYMESVLPSIASKIASDNTRGTAMGIYSCFQFLGIFLGGVTTGTLQHFFGSDVLLAVMIILMIAWTSIISGINTVKS